VTDLNYGGIPQRAVVVWSEEMKKRNEKTFERRLQKESIDEFQNSHPKP
jgi:transposase